LKGNIVSSTIGEPQPTPSTLRWMNADGWRVVMARSIALSLSPLLAGALLAGTVLTLGLPFLLCGGLKATYDMLLYSVFRKVKPPA
jgi:hypothetical protein